MVHFSITLRQKKHQVTQGHITDDDGGDSQLEVGQQADLLDIVSALLKPFHQMSHFEQSGGTDHQREGEGGITRREGQTQQFDEGQIDDAGHQDRDTKQHGHQQQGGILADSQVAGQREACRRRQNGDGRLGCIRDFVAEDEAIEHQRQHQTVADDPEPEQHVGQRRKLTAREGDVSHDDPDRRYEPARHHVVDLELFGAMPDEGSQEQQVNSHGKQPERFTRLRSKHTERLGDHHGAHGIGRHDATDYRVCQILHQQVRVEQKLEGKDHQQHSGNSGAQQLHPSIEVTCILPTPTETGNAQRQTRHGGWRGSQGFTGSCDHDDTFLLMTMAIG